MTDSYPPVQYSMMANGDQIVLRAKDGDELNKLMDSTAQNAGDIADSATTIKSVLLAKGVFTGDAGTTGGTSAPASSGSAPSCEHGTMADKQGQSTKAGNPYKYRYYCTKFGSDCKPQN